MLMDVAVPEDRNVIKKEAEKILKYKNLITEIHCKCNMKAKVILIITGVTGTISKSLRQVRKLHTRNKGTTGVLISPYPDQEGNKLERQKILSFIYPIYNHNWRNISTIYIYNKTSIKQNILTIKQNTSGSRSG